MESDLNRIQLGQIESLNRWRLNQDSPDIAHQLGHQTQEARRANSVDNTMVPAKAQRLNETGLKRAHPTEAASQPLPYPGSQPRAH